MAMHVRYKSLYISLPSSAKQQREMTKFCVFWTTAVNFSYFHLKIERCRYIFTVALATSETSRRTEQI